MSLSKRDFYGEPVYNDSGEEIPAFAVLQCSGFISFKGKEWFKVKKPDEHGRIYFINGPFPIAASGDNCTGGAANPFKSWGAEALYDPGLGPETNDALIPKPGEWHLVKRDDPVEGDGSAQSDRWAVFVVGDATGDGPSDPGFPSTPSTKRIRVAAVGGGLAIGARFGVLQSSIGAASGVAKSQRGIGLAQFYNEDGSADGAPKEIANPFKDPFPNKAGCQFNMDLEPPEIISVGCTLFN